MLRKFLTAAFFIFILLLMCSAMCQLAFAEKTVQTLQNPFVLFNSETQFTGKNNKVPGELKKFKSFTFPSLNYVANGLIIFAQAKKNERSIINYDIVEGHIQFKDIVNNEPIKEITEKWKQSVIIQYPKTDCAGSPTAVVNGNKIYVFFFKNLGEAENGDWEYNLISGEVTNEEKNEINWGDIVTIKERQFIVPGVNFEKYILTGSEGSGIFIQDSFLVPMEFTERSGSDYFSAIINSSINEGKNWNLVSSTLFAEGMHPAIVEWENKLIMMTSSKAGYRKVYEYNDTGKEWKEAVTSLSGVWGNTKQRKPEVYSGQSGFITAQIFGDKKVILFTQTVENQENDKYKLHLWMTDFKRVYDAGQISTDVDKEISSTLLYAKENLFVAYETWEKKEEVIINFTHLKDHLNNIKNVLEKWIKQDNDLSNSCFAADGTITSGNKCANNKIPTDSLVGFLSGNYSNKGWGDEYWCVDATVTEGSAKVTNVSDGLQLSGTGAGATWPVGEQKQNQQYHFVNYAFTLVATVKINGDVDKNKNSVLGIGMGGSDGKNAVGLWCNEGKWSVKVGEDEAPLKVNQKKCVQGRHYIVSFVFEKDKTLEIYVEGEQLIVSDNNKPAITTLETITHFYFGTDSKTKPKAETDVTIKNVLLYNRPFSEQEIKRIQLKQDDKASTQDTIENDTSNPQNANGSAAKSDSSSADTSPLPSPSTTEDSAVRVTMDLLCFMLFGVFTLLGRYVY